MTIVELSNKLVEMYESAEGEKVVMIHLFGVKYANEIHKAGCNANDIIQNARLKDGTYMPDSYKTEISKGLNLAKYVVDKKSIIDYINNKGN
jgi:hypothetical protein